MNKINSFLGITTSKHDFIDRISLDLISKNPFQPRQVFDNEQLEELAESIKQYGILQPLILKKISSKEYIIIAGERRFRAARLAGLKEVPAILKDLTDSEMAEIAIIENLQRENLNFLEEAEGFKHLIEKFNMTQEEVAKKLGKSQSMVANKLRLLKLSPKVKEELSTAILSERHVRALLRLENENDQLFILERIYENNLNVKQTEDLIKTYLENVSSNSKKTKIGKLAQDKTDYRLFQNTIKKSLKDIEFAGAKTEYYDSVKDDHLEIVIKIFK